MRIALRTSGGRGEYELAGTHGDVGLADVLDKEIVLQLFPGQSLDTGNIVRRVSGKTRIRLRDTRQDRHIYLVLADILLMPKPKRELAATPAGKLQLTENNYSVASIQFDVVSNNANMLVIQPSDLVLENSGHDLARIDVLERTRILLDVWASAAGRLDTLGIELVKHRDTVRSGNLPKIFEASKAIRNQFGIEDPLREALRVFSLLDQYTYWLGVHRNNVEESLAEENTTPIIEAKRQRINQWRLQASRGAAGQRFSREVKTAYNNTCLLTGYFLPKLDTFVSAGVDSAHILPWAGYGINTVQNGICLSKLCHWAFDNGVIRLTYDRTKGIYNVRVTDSAMEFERNKDIDLQFFRGITGDIPVDRLPSDRANWPSPDFLEAYNDSMQDS